MRRVDKYKDTEYFHYYNANPRNRINGDCVARAICVAMDMSWEDCVREMTEIGLKHGLVFNDKKNIDLYMKHKGWIKCSEPRNWDNTKMTVEAFIRYNNEGTIVANAGSHHIICIKDKKVWDIWDSSRNTMHAYWRKS